MNKSRSALCSACFFFHNFLVAMARTIEPRKTSRKIRYYHVRSFARDLFPATHENLAIMGNYFAPRFCALCYFKKIDRKYLLIPMLIFPRLILLWRHPETILVFSGIHQSTRTVMSNNYDIPVQLTLFPLYVSRCWCIYFHGQSVRYGSFSFFFLLRAIKRLDARVVPSHRRYINFKPFALIFAAAPPTIEMRPQKCNFFNLASNYEKRDSRMSKVSSETTVYALKLWIAHFAQPKRSGQFAAAL